MMKVIVLLSLHKAQEKRDDPQERDGQKNESRKRKLLTKENAPTLSPEVDQEQLPHTQVLET
jgi:hypothetical protein